MSKTLRVVKSKKGTVADFIWISVTAVVACIIVVLMWNVYQRIVTVSEPLYTNYTNTTIQQTNGYNRLMDIGFMILFFGSSLVGIVFAYFVRSHPAFYFLSVFLIVIAILLAYIGGQVYTNVVGLDVNSGVAESFPIMNFVMSNLGLVVMVLIALQMIALYSGYISGA